MSTNIEFVDIYMQHVDHMAITADRFRSGEPFNQLPELPPPARLETQAVLKACIPARAALAELNAASELIPTPAILVNIIPILEALASSEIENIVTTADRLFQFAGDDAAADPATKEALRYCTALRSGYALLAERPVCTNLAVEVCTVLRGIDTAVRRIPGTALRNASTGEAVYTPPEGEARLRRLLANWETFLHTQERLDPLVRMAVGHYQFEAIHPFEDGRRFRGKASATRRRFSTSRSNSSLGMGPRSLHSPRMMAVRR